MLRKKSHDKYEDAVCLSRDLRRGKEAAFDYFFRTRYHKTVMYAVTLTKNMETAQDIVQDVFYAIWTKSAAIREGLTLDAYLHTCVYHRCIDYINNSKRYAAIMEKYAEDLRSGQAEEPVPGDYVWLSNAVASLPRQCREILNMVIVEGLKYREVATTLHLSENTVKTQMKIAYRKIRKYASVKNHSMTRFNI